MTNIGHKVLSAKNFIHENFAIVRFLVIKTEKDYAIVSQQPSSKHQAILYKGEPRGVVEPVIVIKTIAARVVWRVDVDALDLAFVSL